MNSTVELLKSLQNQDLSLKDFLERIPNLTFVEYLEFLMNHKQIPKSILIKKAELDRTYGYQILQGLKQPSRNKVLMIAISLKASIDETQRLLSLSDNGSLYPKVKRDACLIYCLANHLSVIKTNQYLNDYHMELLM